MFETPKLYPALFYGLLAALFFALSQTVGSPIGQATLTLCFGVCALLFGVTLMRFTGHFLSILFDEFMASITRTRQSVLADKIRGLTPEQLRVVKTLGDLDLTVSPAPDGPRTYVLGTSVPMEFVRDEFLPRCTMDKDGVTHLAPVGSWSEGAQYYDYGSYRDLCAELTDHLIKLGWALPASGNQAARLTAKKDGYWLTKAFGLNL